MSSTYSPSLRIELIGAGEQAGTWNTTTNTNLGTLIESSIAGYISVAVTTANQALTALDGAPDQARNAVIGLTTSTGANFTIYAPPQEKQYIIWNTTAYVATIYNSTVQGNTVAAGAGVSIPAGRKLTVFSTGTNFYTTDVAVGSISGVLPVVNGGTGVTTSTGSGSVVLSTSPTLITPALGTPTALVGTNITGTASGLTAGNVTTNANLTGAVTSLGNATSLGSFTSLQLLTALTDETGSGANVFATSPTLVTPILGTPTSATLTNATGLPINGGTTGTLPVLRGGTGTTTSTGSGSVVLSTSPTLTTPTLVTPILGTPTSGTLTNATGLPISTGVSGLGANVATFLATPSSANLAAALTDETGTGSVVLNNSPTLITPVLGTPASGTLDNCTSNTESFGTSNTQLATTAFVQAALQALHPIGSIYTSTAAANPGVTFGFGTWVAYGAGRVLLAAGGGYTAGATGGSVDAVLPSHTHTYSANANTGGQSNDHSHAATSSVSDPGHAHTNIMAIVDSTPYTSVQIGTQNQGTVPTSTATTGITVSTSLGGASVGHTHNVTVAGTTAANGVSPTNANLQPYVVVYMWNRTA